MKKDKCLKCAFYENTANPTPVETGRCHRYPPTDSKAHKVYHAPTVRGDGWCGEFKKATK